MSVLSKIEKSFGSAREAGEKFKAVMSGVASETESAGAAATRAAPKMSKFTQSILRVAKYRMIRAALRAVVDAVKEGAESFYNFSSAVGAPFAAAMDSVRASSTRMKNQVGAAFGELYTAIAPIILSTIELLNRLANALTMIFAAFSGKGGWYKAKEGFEDIGDAAGGAGSAAKEALRYLAPFDELNRLPSDNGSSGGGGGGGGGNFGDMYEWVPFEEGSMLDTISDFVSEKLQALDLLLDVFVFGVGAILAFSGANVPLGIGMMIVGAYKGYHDATENWDAIKDQLSGSFAAVTALISGGLVIGALLAFSGAHIGLGLGLLVAGAAGLGTTIAANWNAIKNALEGPIGEATAVISGATLLLGVILCIAQLWGPGIGLIVAGAGGLGTTVAYNWNAFVDKIKDIIFEIEKEVSLGVAWVEDYIGRGGAQLIIDAINSLSDLATKAVNGIIDDINEIVENLPAKLKKWLNIPDDFHLEHVDWKIIPDLDPPVGELYNQSKEEWEEKSRQRHWLTYLIGDITDTIDSVPTRDKVLDAVARFVDRTYGGGYNKNSFTTFDTTAKWSSYDYGNGYNAKNFSTWSAKAIWAYYAYKNGYDSSSWATWNAKAIWAYWAYKNGYDDKSWSTWNSTANWNRQTTGSNWGGTTWNSTANWNRQTTGSSWAGTTWNSTANFTSRTTGNNFSTTFNSTAKYISVTNGLGYTPTISVNAKIKGLDPQSQLTYANGGVIHSNGASVPITRFASGGLANGSQLFWARESGPELVGTLGGHSAVMNNNQIVASVSNGVRAAIAGIRFRLTGMPGVGMDNSAMEEVMYSAFVRAMNDTEADETIVLDGDVLYSKMLARNRAATYRMGSNPMMSMA